MDKLSVSRINTLEKFDLHREEIIAYLHYLVMYEVSLFGNDPKELQLDEEEIYLNVKSRLMIDECEVIVARISNEITGEEGPILGLAILNKKTDIMEYKLSDLVVSEQCKRRGVGRKLVETASSIAIGDGCSLVVDVLEVNKAALQFYTKIGGIPATVQNVKLLTRLSLDELIYPDVHDRVLKIVDYNRSEGEFIRKSLIKRNSVIEIDSQISDLVRALNEVGLVTTYSCSGHNAISEEDTFSECGYISIIADGSDIEKAFKNNLDDLLWRLGDKSYQAVANYEPLIASTDILNEKVTTWYKTLIIRFRCPSVWDRLHIIAILQGVLNHTINCVGEMVKLSDSGVELEIIPNPIHNGEENRKEIVRFINPDNGSKVDVELEMDLLLSRMLKAGVGDFYTQDDRLRDMIVDSGLFN